MKKLHNVNGINGGAQQGAVDLAPAANCDGRIWSVIQCGNRITL